MSAKQSAVDDFADLRGLFWSRELRDAENLYTFELTASTRYFFFFISFFFFRFNPREKHTDETRSFRRKITSGFFINKKARRLPP